MHQITLLVFSIALIAFGLDLFLAPRQYKLYGANLRHSLARSPIWLIQGLGLFLSVVGLLAVARL